MPDTDTPVIDYNEFDFGFTAVTEAELAVVQEAGESLAETTEDLLTTQQKLDRLFNMITPLLNNLAANPEKDYIYWPDRGPKVEAFSDAITAVYNR